MHKMRTVATDDLGVYHCSFLCHVAALCETAKRIDVLFGAETPEKPRHIVLNWVPIPHREGKGFDAAFGHFSIIRKEFSSFRPFLATAPS